MVKRLSVMLLSLLVLGWSAVYAAEKPKVTATEFEASLKYQKGEIVLPGGVATLKIPESFRYLDPKDAEQVLVKAWGNPNGAGTLGMLFPVDVSPVSENSWGVVITYKEDGYVSDKDADSINYDDLLNDMRKGIAEENKKRQKEGFPAVNIVGWATPPHYDKETHKLYWAKELGFGGEKEHTLNYNIRVLGRKGVLVLNAVSAMSQLRTVEKEMQQVLAFTDFNSGFRYADYDSKTDKAAAYGIAALVAGGVAAKAGLFTKLFGLLLAAKKLIIAGVVAVGAFIAKRFKKGDDGAGV